MKGTWRGTFDGSPATLEVTREDGERSTFEGLLFVDTAAGRTAVPVQGRFADGDGDALLTLTAGKALREPVPGAWDAHASLAGRLAEGGDRLVGAGRAGDGREFLWRLRRDGPAVADSPSG
jgi:hypothetical protein